MELFSAKKFFQGFNFLDGAVRGKLYHQIIVIVFVLWVVWFILDRATSHTNTTTVTVSEGGVAHVGVAPSAPDRRWSIGGYVETRTQDAKDATVGLRIDFRL
jgi:hypothetical protein